MGDKVGKVVGGPRDVILVYNVAVGLVVEHGIADQVAGRPFYGGGGLLSSYYLRVFEKIDVESINGHHLALCIVETFLQCKSHGSQL